MCCRGRIMAAIMDYLDWREDVPFTVDPFNDVDGLIFSELAYVDFENVLQGRMSIQEAAKRYFRIHSKEEIVKRKSFYRLTPFLLEKLAHSKRFENLHLSHYINRISSSKEMQMSALVLSLEELVYVAYRGTDDTLVGWKEDFNLSYRNETSGQSQAVRYLNQVGIDTENKPLYVGGHSKGGNFAVYASVYCLPEIQKRIQCVYSHDGPGFLDEVTASKEYQMMLPRIKKIIPEQSAVGVLLDSQTNNVVVKSSQSGIMQHDGLSWQVQKNRFVTTNQSSWSLFWDKTIQEWLCGLNAEDKQQFIDTIFGVFERANVRRLEDMSSHTVDIVKAINSLPKQDSGHVQAILRKLIGSSRKVLFQNVNPFRKE